MHIDEGKRFDKRNVAQNIKNGIVTQKDYEIFLSKLPDSSEKVFNPGEDIPGLDEIESRKEGDTSSKKRGARRKVRAKGK
jgi:hypothetical protein